MGIVVCFRTFEFPFHSQRGGDRVFSRRRGNDGDGDDDDSGGERALTFRKYNSEVFGLLFFQRSDEETIINDAERNCRRWQ